MARKVIGIALAAVLVAVFCTNATGQSEDCNSVIVTLLPCLPYIQGQTQEPSQPCCGQLANVVQNHPQCLCLLLKGKAPIPINVTRALALPGLCKINTPPPSKCDEAPAPAFALLASSSPSTPTIPPSASSNPTTPSTPSTPSESSSSGSSNKSIHSMLFVILFIAACVSSLTNL